MEEKTISPLELKVTFIHKEDNSDRKKTWEWLDKMFKSGELEKILYPVDTVYRSSPSCSGGRTYRGEQKVVLVTAVRDPVSNVLFVYDGNKRTAHAKEHHYDLPVRILTDQNDLNQYLKEFSVLWFGITDFKELIELMRMYGEYSHEDSKIPSEILRKMSDKYWQWQHQQMEELFGPDDDD